MQLSSDCQETLTFVVRMWRGTDPAGRRQWRGRVEHVETREVRYEDSMAGVISFIECWIPKEVTRMSTPSPIQEAIVAANQQFMSAFGRGDAAGLAQLYTEEGQVLPPQGEPITGRPGIQAFWQGAIDMGLKGAILETVEVIHQGNTACEVGRYTLEAEGGQPVDHGKYVVLWQRQGEHWRLHRDIWNTSRPREGVRAVHFDVRAHGYLSRCT